MSEKPTAVMMAEADKQLRHMRAIQESDLKFLRSSLEAAASRFFDIATILGSDADYDATGFLKASAEHYRAILEVL